MMKREGRGTRQRIRTVEPISILGIVRLVPLLAVVVFPIVSCNSSSDVPNNVRIIRFSGFDWRVKSGPSIEPGPNAWSDSEDSVYVDRKGRLHLLIRYVHGTWKCAEVTSMDSFGYGTYRFQVTVPAAGLPDNAVAGFFVYEDDQNEIDIELSRWGNMNGANLQYAVQPSSNPENRHRASFDAPGNTAVHSFAWRDSAIDYRSGYGTFENPGQSFADWTYSGPNNPAPGGDRLSLNLWLIDGAPPSNFSGTAIEIIVDGVAVP